MHQITIQFPSVSLLARYTRFKLRHVAPYLLGVPVAIAILVVSGTIATDPVLAVSGLLVGFAAGWTSKK